MIDLTKHGSLPTLSLSDANRIAVSIASDGKVTIAEGLTLDQASREFWSGVERFMETERTRLRHRLKTAEAQAARFEQLFLDADAERTALRARLDAVRDLLAAPLPAVAGEVDEVTGVPA